MCRQIIVNSNDTKYQRILWRNDSKHEVNTYELNTVTYGTAPASFLAVRCMFELANDVEKINPHVAKIIREDFYIDDLITGANDLNQLRKNRDDLNSALLSGGFELRKWASNSTDAIKDLTNISQENFVLNHEASVKTLGVQWNACKDMLEYSTVISSNDNRLTKRNILSAIAKIFDPLGLLGPIIVLAKTIMQALWKIKLGWDEEVPVEIERIWLEFIEQLDGMGTFSVPRKTIASNFVNIECHGFCDASEKAYGACVYLKTICSDGKTSTTLLCSKSKVAPIKTITLPRLELCAAVLLAQLLKRVTNALKVEFSAIRYYTDSMIVLAWIRSCPSKWKIFVANRVTEIQKLTNVNDWYHIGTKNNPADIISRGALPASLFNSALWWHGPPCVGQEIENLQDIPIPENIPEIKERQTVLMVTNVNHVYIANKYICNKFSKFSTIIRVTAWCRRFLNNYFKLNEKRSGPLSIQELSEAESVITFNVQQEEFSSDFKSLKKYKTTPRKSKLSKLNAFIDENQIMRVGGRLRHSALSNDAKFPIILPSSHPFTVVLMRHMHEKMLHVGPQATLAHIRERYWPLSGRKTVRTIINKCITCFRAKPKSSQPIKGDLPSVRVEQSRPFLKTGVDYFGPLYVKESKRKNSSLRKTYAAVFVCMSTKAVHIELVGDLTTSSFLAALRRFIGRRGVISHIYSDNATNFVGAEREIANVVADPEIQSYVLNLNIKWHFIPPRAPHMGGLWEASVKSSKHHLKRVACDAHLNFEELTTLLVQIEAILNSRPLIPLSDDPNDLSPLTPGHFLIGDPLIALPEQNVTGIKLNRLNHWQRIAQIKQHFWNRWSKEYLNELQGRVKWTKTQGNLLSPGQLVIIKDDNVPVAHWKTGRIQEVHP